MTRYRRMNRPDGKKELDGDIVVDRPPLVIEGTKGRKGKELEKMEPLMDADERNFLLPRPLGKRVRLGLHTIVRSMTVNSVGNLVDISNHHS
jgi:hypothetical protein